MRAVKSVERPRVRKIEGKDGARIKVAGHTIRSLYPREARKRLIRNNFSLVGLRSNLLQSYD